MHMKDWKLGIVLAPMLLAGCQTAGRPPLEAVRAACVSQTYLRLNGYLNTPPDKRLDLSLTAADTQSYEFSDGRLDFERLIKDRRNRFTGKLRGVKLAGDGTKYTVIYGPAGKSRRCLGVVPTFAFAYVMQGQCNVAPPFVRLRERSLECGP